MSRPEFVLCLGRFYLGKGPRARVSAIEHAQRFTDQTEAEERAEQLRRLGAMYSLPWRVETVEQGGAA